MFVKSLICILLPSVLSIWLPSYEISLHQNATFEIMEMGSDDFYDDADEMLKGEGKAKREDPEEDHKYFRLHQMADNYNKKYGDQKLIRNYKNVPEESNFDLDDPVPWEAGNVDNNGKFIEKKYYSEGKVKSLLSGNRKTDLKREDDEEVLTTMENYDYRHFKKEYSDSVKEASASNETLNFTETKEDETVKEAIQTVINGDGKNCTEEEKRGIGTAAIKCIYYDFGRTRSSNSALKLIEKCSKIALIWFCVWLIIAIPCWCTRGWCCCCFCCKCCRPQEQIDDAKKFFARNPPGVYHKDGKKQQYQATVYETHAQNKLEKAILNL